MVDERLQEPVAGQPCAQCGGSTDIRTPHVAISGGLVRAYCSAQCASGVVPLPRAEELPPDARGRRIVLAGRMLLLAPLIVFLSGRAPRLEPAAASSLPFAAAAITRPATPAEDPAQFFGPHWPPTDDEWKAEIGSDAWIHPLDGPNRRMPISDSRVFGAERAGDRPGECKNGHCGVDLSGPWGEPVHAVHDGVVERVQRGPNEEHGGVYVTLAHRDGTILSKYFHLAAVPRHLEPGVHVKVGEVIGLLGDTGVHHSAPHLHFTLSVRPSPSATEKYMDPEPLIALWPLRISVGDQATTVTTTIAPGVPHGAARSKKHKGTASRADDAPAAVAADTSSAAE
jgi:murein DD-endopeptidase MepM/ murein hydrolase activator NlpD